MASDLVETSLIWMGERVTEHSVGDQVRVTKYAVSFTTIDCQEPGAGVTGDHLDSLADLVTPGLVRQCCPWVGEIRTLLQQWEGGKRLR